MLKQLVERKEIEAGVLIADVGDSDRQTTTTNVQTYQTSTNVKYVLKLVNTQRRWQKQLRDLFKQFQDVFIDRPGLTDLVENHLKLKDDRPFRQAANSF